MLISDDSCSVFRTKRFKIILLLVIYAVDLNDVVSE